MNDRQASAADALPILLELLVDEVCNSFERSCQSGAPTVVADFLHRVPERARPALQRELAAINSYYRQAHGADHEADLETDRLAANRDTPKDSFPADLGTARWDQPTLPGRRIGDYELLDEIARGGMGVVYRARQISLDRHVALKLILSGSFASDQELARFQLEAEAVAKLDHPQIVPVYDFGRAAGRSYLAMKLIEGGSLAERMADFTLANPREQQSGDTTARPLLRSEFASRQRRIASLLSRVARAVHYAHQFGILHRDLKPSNILLDGAGSPLVTDFGLAKSLDDADLLTQADAILGTPAYMAPEMIQRGSKTSNTSVDIYALGVILYELLAGRPPLPITSPLETLQRIVEEEPPPLRGEVAVDLRTICLKCLQKDPAARYGSALELAEDLERFERNEPIAARPVGLLARVWMWCRRNPRAAAIVSLVVTLVLTIVGVTAFSASKLREERDATRMALWNSLKTQAKFHRQSGQAGQRFEALAALAKAADIKIDQELRDEAITCMTLPDLRVAISWPMERPITFVGSIAFDPALHYYACPGKGCVAIGRVPSTTTGHREQREIVGELKGINGYPAAARFSWNSQLLAVRCETPQGDRLQVWQWRETSRILQVAEPVSGRAFDFHPDNRRLFVAVHADEQWRIATCDLDSGQQTLGVSLPSKPFELRCDPIGRHLAISFPQAESVWVLDAANGAIVHTMDFHEDIFALAWHPDGEVLAVARGFQVDLRDLSRPQHPSGVLTGHRWMIFELMFDSTGELLASHGLREGETRLWDVRTRETVLVAKGHAAGFSPDGRRLAFQRGSALGVWRLNEGHEYRRLLSQDSVRRTGLSATFLANGRLLADSGSGGLRIWDLAGPDEVLHVETGKTLAVRTDPTSGSLLSGGEQGLRQWAVQLLSDGHVALGPPEDLGVPVGSFVADLDCSADGSLLAAVLRDEGRIWVWDRRQDVARFLPCDPKLGYVAVSPDGRWIAGGCFEYPGFFAWNARTHETVWQPGLAYAAGPVRFSPDGLHLLACGSDRYSLRAVADWQQVWSRRRSASAPGAAAFTADSQIAAIVESHDRLALIEVRTGRKIASLDAGFDPGVVLHLEFSPDDGLLAASCSSGGMRIWNLRRIRLGLQTLGLNWDHLMPAATTWNEDAELLAVQLRKIPGRQAGPMKLMTVPLQDWANQKLDDDLCTGEPGDNNLASLPRGGLTLAGVPFLVGDRLIQLGSSDVPHHPSLVEGIHIGQAFRRLHIVHAVVQPGDLPLRTVLAHYRVHYDDGQTEDIPIQYGLDVWNFWANESQLTHLHLELRPHPALRTAWVGKNLLASRNSKQVRLYLMSWSNPHPEKVVTRVDLVAAERAESLICVALTADRS